MPSRKRDPPCCRCNGSHACCKSCSCARAGKPCKDCHPVRHGSCRNNNNAPPTTGTDLSSGGLTVTTSYIATTQSTQPTCSAVKHSHGVVDQPNCAAATHSFSNTYKIFLQRLAKSSQDVPSLSKTLLSLVKTISINSDVIIKTNKISMHVVEVGV